VSEVEQALAVRWHERRDEDQGGDVLGAVGRRLGHDDAAHAVADEDRRLGPARQNLADPPRAARERDALDGGLVGASAGQVERVDRVTRRFEVPDHRLPAPCASERAVDKDESRHCLRS
jgi:hypothetical protein